MKELAITDLANHVGDTLGESPWLEVTQAMINTFAEATGDHQWIHVDVDRARRESPWKSPVAHGFLTASLMPRLNQQVLTVTGTSATINYGLNRLRFPAAVPAGAMIRSRVVLKDLKPMGDGRSLATYETTVDIQGEERPACVAENLALYVH
ncbi:MaoC family dehydratase [Marinobacter sp. C2H3]|uniref:MaoC family dehydratase n=1 Tax=Marinobacter sp. C2H3 TaxID=3119003 RepID=UPI00300EA9C7